MKYLIYLRVSTGKQDTEMQRRVCLEYLQNKHKPSTYTHTIYDEGDLTSDLPMKKRPELMRMLGDLQPGCTVLVYELDRLARDVVEQVEIYRLITKSNNCLLYSINEPNCDELTVTIMGAIAQKNRERIQGKTKDKIDTKKKKGERYSRFLPYGFGMHETKLVPIRVGNEIVMKRGVLVELVEEQKVLALMQELFAEGRSYQNIASTLTSLGYMNREGKPFQKMSICRILTRITKTMSSDQPQEERESLRCG